MKYKTLCWNIMSHVSIYLYRTLIFVPNHVAIYHIAATISRQTTGLRPRTCTLATTSVGYRIERFDVSVKQAYSDRSRIEAYVDISYVYQKIFRWIISHGGPWTFNPISWTVVTK